MAEHIETFLGTFGMNVFEVLAAVERAKALLGDEATAHAMAEFSAADPMIDKRKSEAVRGTGAWLGDAGTASMICLFNESPRKLDSWEMLLDRVLVYPPCYRDLADWWLFFTALDAATGFQLERCSASKREARLTGHLLEALSAPGKVWSETIAPAIARTQATLAISEIDLEIGGGEQSTGGDFGVILDFDGKTIQPSAKPGSDDRRIVPLIFQAKDTPAR